MIVATVTLNVALFIFFLLIAFIIGLLVAFAASTAALRASHKEFNEERERMRKSYKALVEKEKNFFIG